MADDVLEFSGLRVNFDDKSGCNGKVNGLDDGNRRFYIGQLISLQINLPLTEAGLKKLITSHSEKSPVAQNLFLAFMRQLSTTVDLKYSFKPFVNESSRTLAPDSHQWMECLLISTLHDAQCCPEKAKGQPFLSKDKSSYHIPLLVRIPTVPIQSSTIQLEVQAKPVTRHTPCWLSSPTRDGSSSLYHEETNLSSSIGKTVSVPLRIIHPPQLKFQQKSVAGKEMIFLQIKNTSAYYCMKIDQCVILPESGAKSSKSQTCHDGRNQQNKKLMGYSQYSNMIKMVSGTTEKMDNLFPSESYTLCYILNTTGCLENLSKEELTLEVHIKWSIPYQQYGDQSTVQTTYRLPTMKVKQAPFVMYASLKEAAVRKGDSFTVHYSITNRLQDFLSITLNWNPQAGDDRGSIESFLYMQAFKDAKLCCSFLADERDTRDSYLQKFQDGLVCQDPCIELGPCSFGSTLQAIVRFQALSEGVYEVCKHMKINLRYLIPSSETVSLGSPCSQTSEDLLCVAAEDLWRSRSGSGSSFSESRFWNFPKVDDKFSLAYKSYSSGDLGPVLPVGESEASMKNRGPFEDRSTVQKLDVSYSSRFEQLLLAPSNFMKCSCQIYVK